MATSFGLETVLVPTGTDPDQFIDVVALHGIAGLGRESWLYAGDGELKYKKWFEDQYPNIRFSVYDYPFLDSQANVFVRGGIRREALRLLEALTALRAAGEEKKRRIMFFGHDVGGVIVKEALIMSAFGDVRFRDIYLSTRRIIFFGLGQQCDGVEYFRQSFIHLLGQNKTSDFGPVEKLAGPLAKTVVEINRSFLEAKVQFRTVLINVYSTNAELSERVFSRDPMEQQDWWKSTAVPHAHITFNSDIATSIGGTLTSQVSTTPATERSLFLLRAFSRLAISLPEIEERFTPSKIVNDKLLWKWGLDSNRSILVVQKAGASTDDAARLGAVINSRLLSDNFPTGARYFQHVFFFAFREWDPRCNSVETLLCTFLSNLARWEVNYVDNSNSRCLTNDWDEKVLGHRFWNLEFLWFRVYQAVQYLTYGDGRFLFWTLANVNDKDESHRWLLKKLETMTIDSDIKFKLVIVNHDSPPPSLKSQNLKIAVGDINRQANTEKETSPPDNDAETDTKIAVGDIDRQASTEEETPSPDLDTKIDAKADNKEVFDEEHILLQPLARDLDTLDNMSKSLELVLELPRLYPLKSSLAKLFTESEAEGLGEALCVWVRDKGINTPIDSLEQEITQLSPISPKKLFKQIILPTLALPRTKEWAIPTLELLLHAFRPLTIYEVEDLVTTQPSNQLQKDESSQALRYGASMAGLHGLIVVQHSEIHFGHPAFREFLLAGEGGQKLQASSGLHARITAACLEYLLSAVDNGLLTDYQEDDPMPESRLDFSSYAVNYWPRHLKLAGSDLSPDSPPIKKLIEHETALDVWAKAYWNRSNPTTRSPASCISSAAIAAEHGLESLLERILKKRKQISSFEEECFHALEAAARNGHGSLVRNLLTVPLPEDRRLEAVALATLDGRHVEIFRQIIQKLDVDATSPKALSEIFQKAALLGLVDEMKLLIPLMPADTDWDPILYTACMGGSLKSVKLVLESVPKRATPPTVSDDSDKPETADKSEVPGGDEATEDEDKATEDKAANDEAAEDAETPKVVGDPGPTKEPPASGELSSVGELPAAEGTDASERSEVAEEAEEAKEAKDAKDSDASESSAEASERSASPEPKVAEDPKAPASALEVACIYGHVEISAFLAEKKIISARAINKDEPEPSDKEWFDMFAKVIHIAEQSGQSEVLRSLLAVASKWDYTSYSFALERCLPCLTQHHVVRCCKVVFDQFAKFLTPEEVSEKAKPQLKNAVERGDPDMLRELLSRIHGTIDKETRDELWKAAKDKGDLALDVFSLLADEGSKVWDKEELSDVLGATLCAAAKSNSPKLVDFLIERGAELNKQDELGRTPLFQAAWHGNNGIVKRLIEAKADLESTAPCDDNGCCGWTPLFASYDQAATLEILLEAGSNVNVKSEHGTTVLWLSGTRGHMDAVKALIKGKPEVATLDTLLNKKTPLSDAAARENPEIVRLLLDAGSNPSAFPAEDLEAPLLHECVKNSNLEILRMFLEYPLPLDQRDGDGNTPLTSITADTSVPVVRLLVNRGASLELTNSGDLTPLGKAITVGNIDVAKYLISVGANVQASVGRSGTILHVACSTGEGGLPAVKLLIDSGADVNNADPGPNGTPFQAACRRAETDTLSDTAEIINYLVDDVKIQVRQQSNWWGSNLSVACLVADLDIVDKLIERGADVEAEDRMGRQPIHFALFRTVTYVERLRSQGADLFDTDLMGRGPLHIAVLSGRLELVQYVLAQKEGLATEKDVDNWTPLLWAVCFVGNWKTETSERGAIVSELLKHGASRLTEGEGLDRTWTALKLARYYGLPEEIIDLVTPTEDELQSLGKDEGPWRYSIRNDTRQAKVYPGSFCDACLMVLAGVYHLCDECPGFCLCFKCYRSKNTIHPEHDFHDTGESNEYVEDQADDTVATTPGATTDAGGDENTSSSSEHPEADPLEALVKTRSDDSDDSGEEESSDEEEEEEEEDDDDDDDDDGEGDGDDEEEEEGDEDD